MNPQGTSFIPQRPTSGTIRKGGVKKVYILTYVSFIVFFGTIVSAAGTYGYQVYEQKKLNEEKKMLADEKAKFNESDLDNIRQLYYRMENAKAKLDAHVSLLPIFKALEESTVQSILFTGFTYTRADAQAPSIVFSGTAKEFNSILFQRGLLEANPLFAKSVLTDMSLINTLPESQTSAQAATADKNAKTITFKVTSPLDASLISFKAPVSSTSSSTSNSSVIQSQSVSASSSATTLTPQQ